MVRCLEMIPLQALNRTISFIHVFAIASFIVYAVSQNQWGRIFTNTSPKTLHDNREVKGRDDLNLS